MTITEPTSTGTHPVAAAVAAVSAALDGAAEGSLWSLPDAELLAVLEAQERLAAKLAAVGLRLVREADGRDLAARRGATDTVALLRHRLRLRPGEAKTRVVLAAALDAGLAATGQALAAGGVSLEQARAIQRAVADLPPGAPAGTARQAETVLLGHAATFDPGQLAKLGAHIRHLLDPDDLAEREEKAEARREFTLVDRRDGTHRLTGILDDAGAETLRAALDPLAAPQTTPDGGRDPRSPARRRADALVELARRALTHGDLPATGGIRPHVTILAPLEVLLGQAGQPAAETGRGAPLSLPALRQFCCDSWISRVLLGPDGVPLDVGREHRLVTPGIRRAVAARDRVCAFPSCDRPPEWCEVHHLIHWLDGGTTCVENSALLCGAHHTVIHRGEWEVRLGADGHPEFLPPPWIDPERKPRRNPYCRKPADLLGTGTGPPHPQVA